MTPARAAVRGVGLWRPTAGAETPPPRLPPRLRRRASLLINMVAEVAAQATDPTGVSLATVPLVVGSAFGELGTTVDILRDIGGEGIVSPTDFQASVHNTAAAYLSIANANRLSSTSLAAGDDTLAAVLLEALTLLALRGGQVLAIVADEALPEVLRAGAPKSAVSAAWLLEGAAAEGEGWQGAPPLAVLEDLRLAPGGAGRPVESDAPCEAGARLVEAIRGGRWGRFELGSATAAVSAAWSVALCRAEGA